MKEEVQFLPLELITLWKEDGIMPMNRDGARKAGGSVRPASRVPGNPTIHRKILEIAGHWGEGFKLSQTPPEESSLLLMENIRSQVQGFLWG